jgi:hypothetical protein
MGWECMRVHVYLSTTEMQDGTAVPQLQKYLVAPQVGGGGTQGEEALPKLSFAPACIGSQKPDSYPKDRNA